MVESNLKALDMNMVDVLEEQEECTTPHVEEVLLNSLWYDDILYVLLYLNVPPGLSKIKARLLKLKDVNYPILDKCLYWKNASG